MKILVLEDDGYRVRFFIERFGQHDIKITENVNMAIEYLQEHKFDYIFLDNDLGQNNGEGIDVAKYLHDNQNNPNNNSVIIIHSWNAPAAKTIKGYLPNALVAPFNMDAFFNLALDF